MSIGCAVETLQVQNYLKPTYPLAHIQESMKKNLPTCILYDSNVDSNPCLCTLYCLSTTCLMLLLALMREYKMY